MTTPGPDSDPTTSLALLEAATLAGGLASLDACLKQADVALLWTRTIEPGRLLFLLSGGVDELRSALRAGRALLGDGLVDALFLAHTHPSVLDLATRDSDGRIHSVTASDPWAAIGVVECKTVATTILAADTALKSANVKLVRLKLAEQTGGRGLLVVAGATADVESAVNAGATIAETRGQLTRTEPITAPHAALAAAIVGC